MSALNTSLLKLIKQQININKKITFKRFMELALYAPGLGYYSAGAYKLGVAGDFVTAPEISSLFAGCLAKQIIQIYSTLVGEKELLELGAGSGKMAADLLLALAAENQLPERYFILEVSADFKQRQQQYLEQHLPTDLYHRIQWLDNLPEQLTGIIIANEVLDAMPVCKFKIDATGQIQEYFVTETAGQFAWYLDVPHTPGLVDAVRALNITSPNYNSEINLALPAWIAALGSSLKQGAILLIDYGFPQHEYYHFDRSEGTLMCHYQHRAHTDPLINVGLQDITAHVDFTAIAEAAYVNDLQISGYTNQASFLLSCGLLQLAEFKALTVEQNWQLSQQIKTLTLPSEMGELFKVIALTRDIDFSLLGFELLDKRDKL